MGLFRKGKTRITAKFHWSDLEVCSHSRERKTLSYSQKNTVDLDQVVHNDELIFKIPVRCSLDEIFLIFCLNFADGKFLSAVCLLKGSFKLTLILFDWNRSPVRSFCHIFCCTNIPYLSGYKMGFCPSRTTSNN